MEEDDGEGVAEDVELEVDEGVAVVELDDGCEGGGPQGSVDSKFFATYRLRTLRPPQISVLSPLQGILQLLESTGRVPLPRTTPQ
jgi:hypothetical protein